MVPLLCFTSDAFPRRTQAAVVCVGPRFVDMEPEHRALLREHRLDLSGQLLVSESIVPFLYQENILSQTQVEQIESLTTNRQKTLKLLDFLPSCGHRAFHAFLQSLEDFGWIREQLLLELQTRAGSESTGKRRHGPHVPPDVSGISLQWNQCMFLLVPGYPVQKVHIISGQTLTFHV